MQTALIILALVTLALLSIVLCWRNMRSKKHYEDLLQKEQSRAELAELKAMEQIRLMGVISHELRNPLQTVVALVDTLSLHTQGGSQEKTLNRLHKASEQIEAQIADMSLYSHILSGRLALAHERFNPQDELQEVIDEFSEAGEKKGLQFECDFQQKGQAVISDPRRFRQIASNLISNAVKYAEPGPVNVSLTFPQVKDDKTIQMVLVVEDSGPGIAPSKLPSIFNEFSQIGGGGAHETGIGMGLAIIARLITMMDGTINATSTVGKGTRFTVRLPVNY